MANIIDGKVVSASVKQQVADECAKIFAEKGIKPGLAVIIVGDDPASRVYVNNKKKACELLGIYSEEEDFFTSVNALEYNLNLKKPGAKLFVLGTPVFEEYLIEKGFEIFKHLFSRGDKGIKWFMGFLCGIWLP